MHLSNSIEVAENSDAEGLHTTIANVLQMVLVDAPVLSTHSFPQLETNILLEVESLIHSQVCMSVISRGARLRPSPEIISGYPFQFA